MSRLPGEYLRELQENEAIIVDLRPSVSFTSGFLSGSIHLPDADCLELIKKLPDFKNRKIYCIAETEESVCAALVRLRGADRAHIAGWFAPEAIQAVPEKIGSKKQALGRIEEIDPDTLLVRMAAWKTVVLDIRPVQAFRTARIPEAILMPLDTLGASTSGLPVETSLSIVCETGARCSFAASLLWRLGYRKLAVLKGGFAEYVQRGLPTVASRAPG